MGHSRKAASAPSPVQLLAIFSAKESGVAISEISRRTRYSQSTIIRWWQKWGHDTAFYEHVARELPDAIAEYDFDSLFPESGPSSPQATFALGEARHS